MGSPTTSNSTFPHEQSAVWIFFGDLDTSQVSIKELSKTKQFAIISYGLFPTMHKWIAFTLLAFPATVSASPTASAIQHLIVIIQENHSFDSYFGRYCQAPAGSNPSCNQGPECCEAGPARDPGTGIEPGVLDDTSNIAYDPNHSRACEKKEMHHGRMDRFVSARCADRRNFTYASRESVSLYFTLADHYALADRYFQPVAGASSSNDMYFARAQYVFTDNNYWPKSVGSICHEGAKRHFDGPTIGDLLNQKSVSWAFYHEGYAPARAAHIAGRCMAPDPVCVQQTGGIGECTYDPSDNPFQYYLSSRDNPSVTKDYQDFAPAIRSGTLPSVVFMKPYEGKTEHPGAGISVGMSFISEVLNEVKNSPYAENTLILITADESGGFFDHISPPKRSPVDHQLYGPRIPMLAVGPFALKGGISHTQMEHASVVRFIEWNWLGATGQLHGRDQIVAGIGSLLDPTRTGAIVPR